LSHLPLPGLLPDDPENLLSPEARQRISTAVVEQQRIRAQVMSTLETRYRAESSGDVGFGEYLSSGSAFVDLTESHMEAARIVLRVESEEYRKLGLPDSRFREIMREKIDGLVYSLELSVLQDRALELEFVWATSQQAEDEPRSVDRSENVSAADRVKAFMKEKSIKVAAFAEMIRVSKRTIESVLAGDPVGKETRVAVAKALGTTPEELFRE
jgi:lambda repressor-like predicted transcriptional regulator